jgi:hypothetical protein
MTASTDRSEYRALIAQIAGKARAILPSQVNGRIEKAVKLVLSHDVMPQANGSILVGSSSVPMKTYLLTGATCECQDFVHGKAPEGWCQHRIAAGIAKRVGALLPQAPPGETEEPVCHPGEPVCETVSQTLPLGEAPCSVNVHVTIAGRQVQVTLRGQDEREVLARLEAVLVQYPLEAPRTQEGWCAKHGVQMTWNEGKEGRKGWFSHKTDQGWCKGH